MLILVRHAMPDHRPEVAARDWQLSADGEQAARALCARLPSGAHLVASTEIKAIETIACAGDVITDRRFDEVDRDEPYSGDFRTRRLAYIEGADHDGWEPRHDVVRRFSAAVDDHTGDTGGPLVVATHGMTLVLWLTATIRLTDPGAFWAGLGLPDALVVDRTARTVTRLGQ